MSDEIRKIGKHTYRIVTSEDKGKTADDIDMDNRVTAAVNSAIKKAKVCNKPIAKYDQRKKKAYVIDSNGERKYVS